MGLFKQIATQRTGHRRSHRETQELWEPLLLRPKRGDDCQKSPFASLKFVQHLADKGERWKGISLKPVPRLKKRVRARCHEVVQGVRSKPGACC